MSLTIYPAIDISGGKCVRLLQGDYAKETVYSDSPVAMAEVFFQNGAEWVHMVDLDGAKDGIRVNDQFVIEAAKKLGAKIQMGGGIRSEEDVYHYLSNGVERVILGSVAVSKPEFAVEMIRKYGANIVIGIDVRDGFVATNGWLKISALKVVEVGKSFADVGAENFIFTDIATDGTLAGPNFEAIEELASETKKSIIASGGISTLADIKGLAELSKKGITGAIIGKALYENRFTLQEAIQHASPR